MVCASTQTKMSSPLRAAFFPFPDQAKRDREQGDEAKIAPQEVGASQHSSSGGDID